MTFYYDVNRMTIKLNSTMGVDYTVSCIAIMDVNRANHLHGFVQVLLAVIATKQKSHLEPVFSRRLSGNCFTEV
jgi:hypothetical protein